jgi:hypothetical protein
VVLWLPSFGAAHLVRLLLLLLPTITAFVFRHPLLLLLKSNRALLT